MQVTVDGQKLKIELDLVQNPPLSSSGKSLLAFTSGGFVPVPGSDIRINITVIKPVPGRKGS